MRCKNCGWPNKPNERECVKCHSPLVNDEEDINASYSGNTNGNESYSKTVREDDVFGQNASINSQSRVEESQMCPKCGYPLRPGAEKCPNCNFSIKGVDTSGYTGHRERAFLRLRSHQLHSPRKRHPDFRHRRRRDRVRRGHPRRARQKDGKDPNGR